MNEAPESTAEKIERIASATDELSVLALDAALFRSRILHIERSLEDEQHPDVRDISALYAEMGRVLPESVEKTFEQVEAFHRSVTANRRLHLADDLAHLRERLAGALSEVKRMENLRDSLIKEISMSPVKD